MAIEPITRKEQFLAKAGGQQVRDLEPITREEMFLQKIAENSSVQPDLSQNDPDAADYVKGRTHYSIPKYSEIYLDYFDVNPSQVGIGVYPLVLAKEGKENFDFKVFLNPANLQRTWVDGRYHKLRVEYAFIISITGISSSIQEKSNLFFTNIEYIDDTNYKSILDSRFGFTIYAIGDVNALNDEYKGVFSENGVYLEVSKDQSTVPVGACYYFSFKLLDYVPIDEKYVPSIIPRASKATAGQTIVVKSVDSAGNPTEWEAVDLPSGGGNANEVVIRCNSYLPDVLTDSNPNYDAFSYDAAAIANLAQAVLSQKVVSIVVFESDEGGVQYRPYRCYAFIDGSDVSCDISLHYSMFESVTLSFINGVLAGHIWDKVAN